MLYVTNVKKTIKNELTKIKEEKKKKKLK